MPEFRVRFNVPRSCIVDVWCCEARDAEDACAAWLSTRQAQLVARGWLEPVDSIGGLSVEPIISDVRQVSHDAIPDSAVSVGQAVRRLFPLDAAAFERRADARARELPPDTHQPVIPGLF